jgi:hypothetical protein
MKSFFADKAKQPTEAELKKALNKNFDAWITLAEFTRKSYPKATEAWKFSGEKYGWNFLISDKKRTLIYLLPRDGFFKAAFVFGQKATGVILESNISHSIKEEIRAARVYAEGRGIRIEVKNKNILKDLKKLIMIKIGN